MPSIKQFSDLLKNNITTSPPGTSNDITDGYLVHSRWIDTSTTPDRVYL